MSNGLPLEDICVVEIGHSLAAPYAGMIFAGLGARVIKVENEGTGDYARDWGPPFVDGMAALFHAVNHGKASIAVDLRRQADVELLRQFIVARADVVLQNLKPGSLSRCGLGAEQLRQVKPELIYCSLGAFGEVGPMRDKPGYDPLVQAMSGLMSLVGNPGEPPVRIPVSINDMGTGLWATIGVLSALMRRRETGQGETVSVSLYETAMTWAGMQIVDYLACGEVPGRWGSGTAGIVPHQTFTCVDTSIMVAAGNDKLFRQLCAALGAPELADDARFLTNGARVANRKALVERLQAKFVKESADYWLKALDAAGVPCGPLLTIDKAVVASQTKALDLIKQTDDGAAAVMCLPIRFGGGRPGAVGRTPGLGEHNDLLQTE